MTVSVSNSNVKAGILYHFAQQKPVTGRKRKYQIRVYTHVSVENSAEKRPIVLLLIPHLGGGGAERVVALLARGLSREKYELHLGLITGIAPPADAFPPGLTIHTLGAPRVGSAIFRLLALLRRLRPSAIVSGMFHLNFLVIVLRPFFPRFTRVLVRQNATVSATLAFDKLPPHTRLLYRLLYSHADRVICQSPAMANDLVHEIGIPKDRLAVLRNPVDLGAIRTAAGSCENLWTGAGPHLLAVGRLSREKGFDLLLQALLAVRTHLPNADLAIVGAGPEETALKSVCRSLGLNAAVHFAGCVAEPAAYFPGATAFVLSSRHEGLPNALLEAAAGGLPIVALPASEGIRDLLRGQPGTWLAPEITAEALAGTLLLALASLQKRERFTHPFIEEFGMDRAIYAYEELIDATIDEHSC